jgi:hypothetical protein
VRTLSISLVVALAMVTAQPVYAQQSSGQAQEPDPPVRVLTQRPYRGLFGSGYSDTSQMLTLGLNMGGGYDSSIFADDREDPTQPVTPSSRQDSGFAAGSANLNYSLSLKSISLSAGAGGALSYYPDSGDPNSHAYYGNTSVSWSMSPRASLSGSISVAYQPITHLASLPGLGNASQGPTNPFGAVRGGEGESYRTDTGEVGLSYRLSRRVSTSVSYAGWRSVAPSQTNDSVTQGLSGRASISVTKDVGFFVGYRLNSSGYGPGLPGYYTHNADFGLSFAKALSLTRKTTASFGTGTSAVTDGHETRYALTGNVQLMRELGRTWSAALAYDRDVGFEAAFQQPVFSDTVSAMVGGLISRRVSVDAGTGLERGKVGFSNTDNGYSTLYTSAGIGIAITRFLNGGLRYGYSRYQFDNGVRLPADLLFQTGRHGVHAYLSTWLPLFARTRRP